MGRRLNFGTGSVLIHGGGWKRLQDQQVDNATFKARLREQLGIERVFNYYGMVEQVGSIFMECEQGRLHAPTFADVVVRDPLTLDPLPPGQVGVVQVLSALPVSYPGHSLLTEDLGLLHGEDDCPCGRLGRTFSVLGRMPQVEMRGCSDTRTLP
jgi:phenylacetate-coenzyme A ligase PaaK-like adenylate-forming protein